MQPEQIGRYRVVRELGRGTMGRVYLAHDPEIDRLLAIKSVEILASLPEGERDSARERFLREARSAGKLRHPGIVTVFDVGESEGVPYLAMEYVEGTSLDAYCGADSLLPLPSVVEIVARAAEALGCAHEAGVVHRDVKPANLMRIEGNGVKVMDFGLAKDPATQLTRDGSLAGTPNYMSPEQIRGQPLDGRSDLFSLAVVLFEMISGRKPFGGESVSSVLYRIVNEKPARIVAARPGVPRGLAEFLDRALAKRPDDRFATGSHFASALRAAIGTAPALATKEVGAGSPPPRERAPEPRPRRLLPWIGGVGLALAIAGGAAVVVPRFLDGGGEERAPEGPWLESRVRTEPPGVPVTLDGKPLAGGAVRFRSGGPFGLLAARTDCREAVHRIEPADAGGEIVLVLDPTEVEVLVDPGVPGARVRRNGEDAGTAPARLELALCRENVIEVSSEGFRTATLTVRAGASPVDARTSVAALRLEAIPKGALRLPAASIPISFFVDGRRVRSTSGEVELPEGPHRLRAVSEEHWLEVEAAVEVVAGKTVPSGLRIPELAVVVIQAFPPGNCVAYLRRPGGEWKILDEVPVRREIAPGRYEVRVVLEPTGESRERLVDLSPGFNPPLRFAFRSGRAR